MIRVGVVGLGKNGDISFLDRECTSRNPGWQMRFFKLFFELAE
jgi:hypothetical protein